MKVAKKVICYLKDTMHLGLIYSSHLKNKKKTKIPIILFLFKLIRYKNSGYARDFENEKSVIEYYYFINEVIVSWCSKKQKTVLILITKAKYIAFRYIA